MLSVPLSLIFSKNSKFNVDVFVKSRHSGGKPESRAFVSSRIDWIPAAVYPRPGGGSRNDRKKGFRLFTKLSIWWINQMIDSVIIKIAYTPFPQHASWIGGIPCSAAV